MHRDSIYNATVISIILFWNGCRAQFIIEHAWFWFKDLVNHRHNEVCSTFGNIASLVWSPVMKEPIVCEDYAGAEF